MARFVSDDYGTRYNVERIAYLQRWANDPRHIDICFSGIDGDFRTARFRTEDSADAFLMDVCYVLDLNEAQR